jgi:hypothetical protein
MAEWTKTSGGVYIPAPMPRSNNAVWLSTYSTGGLPLYEVCGESSTTTPPPPAEWQTIDITPLLTGIDCPALAVSLGGFVIITSGTGTDDADQAISFQQSGAGQNPIAYCVQGISPGPTQGVRTNFGGYLVPLTNVPGVGANCFDFAWLRGDAGQFPNGTLPPYPEGATYEITIDIRAVYT